jgi:hypothetical protein
VDSKQGDEEMATIRMLLKSNVTRGEVEYMALDYNWQLYTRQEPESTGSYVVWLDGEGDQQTVIIFTEDAFAELRYINVEGENAQAVGDEIKASVATYSREELEANIASATEPGEWLPALRKLGASLTKTFEQWAYDALCKGLEHPEPRVRLAALAAIGFPAWPAFLEPVGKVQETDDDVRVLRRSARLYGLLQRASQTSENGAGTTEE